MLFYIQSTHANQKYLFSLGIGWNSDEPSFVLDPHFEEDGYFIISSEFLEIKGEVKMFDWSIEAKSFCFFIDLEDAQKHFNLKEILPLTNEFIESMKFGLM